MKADVQPGRYIVAVSGGVDSAVLLHMIHANYQQNGTKHQFIVAHFDHGIREDSAEDRRLVQGLAKRYGMPFVYDEGKLGPGASEAAARKARYKFLHDVRKSSGAEAVMTAHHQDDAIETALLNLLRGTGRKGISSLRSTDVVKRPLLHYSKKHLQQYAKLHGLEWREDSTNEDERYKRNYVRRKLASKLTPLQRQQLLARIKYMRSLNKQIDAALENHLHVQPGLSRLDRQYVVMLPHAVALELMAAWLRRHGVCNFDKRGLTRMVVAAKTYAPDKRIDITHNHFIVVEGKTLALISHDR